MRITIHVIKRITYGVQFALSADAGTAVVDYFADSKKRTIYVQHGSTPEMESFIAARLDTLRDRLDEARPRWSRPEFAITLDAAQPVRAPARPAPPAREPELDFGAAPPTAPPAISATAPDATSRTGAPVALFTDGGASPNPGAGACAWIVRMPGQPEIEGARFAAATTNNRMELQAVIEGLSRIPRDAAVTVHCDSKYVQQGISSWIHGWKRKGWKTAKGTDVLNRDLWEKLDAVSSGRDIRWLWVRGHAGHVENERCDELVGLARRGRRDIG